jgi:hypothetical protein
MTNVETSSVAVNVSSSDYPEPIMSHRENYPTEAMRDVNGLYLALLRARELAKAAANG